MTLNLYPYILPHNLYLDLFPDLYLLPVDVLQELRLRKTTLTLHGIVHNVYPGICNVFIKYIFLIVKCYIYIDLNDKYQILRADCWHLTKLFRLQFLAVLKDIF